MKGNGMMNRQMIRIAIIAAIVILILFMFEPGFMIFDIPPHIRNLLWIVFIVSGILLLIAYLQPMRHFPPPPPDKLNEKEVAAQNNNVLVAEYGFNKIGDIDKILALQNGEKIWLHFPPHVASKVIDIAVKNTTINATYSSLEKKAKDGLPMYELRAIRSEGLGKMFDVHSIPPPPPMPASISEISGKEIHLRFDEEGKANAFVLSSKLVELKPATAETLVPLLQNAGKIIVKGFERDTSSGFVNITGFPLIRPTMITIDNTNYIVQ
jgi:hypothetical protein